MAPDAQKAKESCARVIELLALRPAIDVESTSGSKPVLEGKRVQFENIKFRYPTRENVTVFDNLKLQCDSGKVLALVGPSGAGKCENRPAN
jgi:ABC-type multidrug transport system fused ATPase/permease subunit